MTSGGCEDTQNCAIELEIYPGENALEYHVSKIKMEGEKDWRSPTHFDITIENAAHIWADENYELLESLLRGEKPWQ